MNNDKPKSINGLMKYMRDEKHIKINGSSEKLQLRNMGYYHGYKGYRYITSPSNKITFTTFQEISAIYNFDASIKALLYPQVMFLETALKNYVLEVFIDRAGSNSFNDIYNKLLTNYQSFYPYNKQYPNPKKLDEAEKKYKNQLRSRLELRDTVYKVQTKAYSKKNKIAVHYYQKDLNLPIWAIFELLSLGEFGYFVSCAEINTRKQISSSLGIRPSDDTSGLLPQRLIFTLKDLRNAIAHNNVVFDTRFKTGEIDKQIINCLQNATGITNINFSTITDYIILVAYMLRNFGMSKTNLNKFIREFESAAESLRSSIPISVYNQIIHTDMKAKLSALKASL